MLTRLLIAGSIFAAILCGQTLPTIRTSAEADKIEAGLAANPSDVVSRVLLIRYYAQQGAQSPERYKPLRRKQLVWLIEHHPEHSVLSEWAGAMDKTGYPLADEAGFDECGASWQKTLEAPKPMFDAYANAIHFYKTADPARARKIAEEGLKRYPGNSQISSKKGMLLAYAILGVKTTDQFGNPATFDDGIGKSREALQDRRLLENSDDTNLISGAARALQAAFRPLNSRRLSTQTQDLEDLVAKLYLHADAVDPNFGRWKINLMNAYQNFAFAVAGHEEKLAYLEKALAQAPAASRNSVMPDLALEYLSIGKTDKATDAANELLKPQDNSNMTDGYPLFTGNLVMGGIALKSGDTKEAARRLLAAGRAPFSQRLTFSGPSDWSLAQGLLAAGEQETVLSYLDLLRANWKNDNGRLTAFASTIRSGETPNFAGGPTAFSRNQFVGRAAPDFRLKDLKGDEVALSDFKGKVVLLDFWATWCGPCRMEMPEFQRIHRTLASKDVVVLALDVDEPMETAAEYVQKEKFTFPVLLAKDTGVVTRYGVNAFPTTFGIDKNGLVADVIVGGGMESGPRLDALIEKARAGAPAAAPFTAPVAVGATARATVPPSPAVTPEDMYRDGQRLHNDKDYAGAIKALDLALGHRPDWVAALALRADSLNHAKRSDDAIAAYNRAIELDPKRAASYDGRGLAHSNSGRHAQAIEDYTTAIRLNPDFGLAYNNRGWAYLATGRLDEALIDLNKALELNPSYTLALFNRAHVFEKRQEYAKAIADYDSVMHVEPGNTLAPGQRAANLRRLGAGGQALVAPKMLSPAEGAVFEHFPRETTVVWSEVAGAVKYFVEWDYKDDTSWASEHTSALASVEAKSPVATFRFVGAQPGRWRVWAVDAGGIAGPKSEWREFRYTR